MSRRDFIFKLATELGEDCLAERRAGRSASEQESSTTIINQQEISEVETVSSHCEV